MSRKQSEQEKAINRELKAIAIAKVLFEHEGYHTKYLDSIESRLNGIKMEVKSEYSKKPKQ